MEPIPVGNELRDKLNAIQSDARLCDESGAIVGWFLSEAEYTKVLFQRAHKPFDEFSDEELDRAEKQPGGSTTAEVLARLRSLAPERPNEGRKEGRKEGLYDKRLDRRRSAA